MMNANEEINQERKNNAERVVEQLLVSARAGVGVEKMDCFPAGCGLERFLDDFSAAELKAGMRILARFTHSGLALDDESLGLFILHLATRAAVQERQESVLNSDFLM